MGKRLVPDIEIDPLARPSSEMLRAIMQAGVDHVLNKQAADPSLPGTTPYSSINEPRPSMR